MDARISLRTALPALAVIVAMVVLEVSWGADVGSALLYLAYEAGFILLPGWLLYRALASEPGGPVRQLALGWTLGLVLEVFSFMATAAVGARGLFTIYPLVVIVAVVVLARRRLMRTTDAEAESVPAGFDWMLATFCIAAIALIAVAYFPAGPAPGSGSIAYFRDYPFHLAIISEAAHHWPILDPFVSGEPLPYHYFVHVHVAAAGQVTGIDLPQIFFRLYVLPLTLLIVLLYVSAGSALARSARVGLLAAALALFVGEIQLDLGQAIPEIPFLGVFIQYVRLSPSFLFGMPMLLALVILIGERIRNSSRGPAGDWCLVALFAAGASDAKVIVLPTLMAALGLFAIYALAVNRKLLRGVILTGALITAVTLITYLWQYAGHSSGIGVGAFETIDRMPVITIVKQYLEAQFDVPLSSALIAIGAVVAGLLGLLGLQIAAIGWGRIPRAALRNPGLAWTLAVLGVGLLTIACLNAPGSGNELYIVQYCIAVGWLPTAIGIRAIWRERPSPLPAPALAAALAAGWLAVLVVLLALNPLGGANGLAHTYLVRYAGLAISLVVLALLARRLLGPGGWWPRALVIGAVSLIGVLGTFSDYVTPELGGERSTASEAPGALTPSLFRGLSWLRDHTPESAVVAVNSDDPFDFNDAGFSERRMFFETPAYSSEALDDYEKSMANGFVDLFPERRELNTAAFAGDVKALQTLIDDYGVRYLLIDPAGGLTVDRAALDRLSTQVFDDSGVTILELGS